MDVAEAKAPLNYRETVKSLMKLLQYKKYKVELKGSQSLASQKYYSDIDLYSLIVPDSDFVPFLRKIQKRLDDSSEYYFTELKFQTKTGKKTRIYPGDAIPDIKMDGMEMVKLDMIVWAEEGIFEEASIIYNMVDSMTAEEYEKSLMDDIEELLKEGSYYKVLKRVFTLHKMKGDKKQMLRLSAIFNGEMGQEYQTLSRLDAIKKVLESYQEEDVIKKAQIALKNLHIPVEITDIEGWLKKQMKALNRKAKGVALE